MPCSDGSFNEGVLYGEEGIQIAEEVEHPASLIYMNCSLGVLFLMQGEMAKAISAFRTRALKFCHSANIPVYVPFVASRLGAAYLLPAAFRRRCLFGARALKISLPSEGSVSYH